MINPASEKWKAIPDRSNYEMSNQGRVRNYMGVEKEKQEKLTIIHVRCSTAKQKNLWMLFSRIQKSRLKLLRQKKRNMKKNWQYNRHKEDGAMKNAP